MAQPFDMFKQFISNQRLMRSGISDALHQDLANLDELGALSDLADAISSTTSTAITTAVSLQPNSTTNEPMRVDIPRVPLQLHLSNVQTFYDHGRMGGGPRDTMRIQIELVAHTPVGCTETVDQAIQRLVHNASGMDYDQAIWDKSQELLRELTAAKAEIAKLKEDIEYWRGKPFKRPLPENITKQEEGK